MDNKQLFKEFVRKNPILINRVHNGEVTWQKLYEMWDLYGEDNENWDQFTRKEESLINTSSNQKTSVNDIMGWLKNIDMDSVQSGINGLQRIVGLIQDFASKDTGKVASNDTYTARPLFKHFED